MGLNFAGISNETMTLPDNAFQGGFWVTDKKSTNTDGGSFSSGAWRQRDLNEVEFKFGNVGTVGLSGNQITPTEGWYLIMWSAPAIRVGHHNSRIYTSWGGIQYGTCGRTPTSGYHNESRSHGCARFWFNGSQTFGVQHKCDTGQSSSYGFGSGQRDSPRFTEVTCLKYVYDVAGATP